MLLTDEITLIDVIVLALVFLSVLFAIFIVILFMGVRWIRRENTLEQIRKEIKSNVHLGPEILIGCADTLFSWHIRNFMHLPEFDRIKSKIRQRYKEQMSELDYVRFISYLAEDDLHRVDIGIKGLDGLADPRALPELDRFIRGKKDKKEFGELVERAKSVRDRTVELSR